MAIGNSCERAKGVATSRLSTTGRKYPLAVVLKIPSPESFWERENNDYSRK